MIYYLTNKINLFDKNTHYFILFKQIYNIIVEKENNGNIIQFKKIE